MHAKKSSHRLTQLALCAGAMLIASSAAMAQKPQRAAGDEEYRTDVAKCNSGHTNQAKKTCLYEANSARQERARNRLVKPQQDYRANSLQRCRALPAGDQDACVAAMSGQAKTYGSVAGGGVLRETVIQVPVDQSGRPVGPGQVVPPSGSGYQPAPSQAPSNGAPSNGLRY